MKKSMQVGAILLMSVSLISLIGCEGNANKGQPIVKDNVSLKFRRDLDSKDSELTGLKYDENWFLADSYTYNADLAKISLGLALSGYDDSANYDVTNKTGDKHIKQLYQDLGFSKKSYYSVGYDKEDDDNIGLSIASKKFKTEDEQEVTLLSITLRSAGYGNGGWKGNLNMGKGEETTVSIDNEKYHLGFYTAASFAVSEINQYITDKEIDVENSKVWISGFSRGAAVANLVSIILGSSISRNNLYTYAGATPNYEVGTEKDTDLNNIFNIINSGDIVTMVAPAAWGFMREGTTIDLPAVTEANKSSFEEIFLEVAGFAYEGETDFAAIDQSVLTQFTGQFTTRESYANELQAVVDSLLTRNEDGSMNYEYVDNILTCEGTNADAFTIESISQTIKEADLSDMTQALALLSTYTNTMDAGIKYWEKKDSSYNDELLTHIQAMSNFYLSVYIGFSGTDTDKAALNAISDISSKGITAPLLLQHWAELYYARLCAVDAQ